MSLPRYGEYKNSGIEWLGNVPAHWRVLRLKRACIVFPSNVDKHSRDDEPMVRLCNYTDVYYNERITSDMQFMEATASEEQIAKFTLRAGDTIITKDSETADDIAISAYVPNDLPGVVCGYHLSMVRPLPGTAGGFVKRLFDSVYAKARFAVAANGLTRVGLAQYALDNVELPFPPESEQIAIAAFLDRETSKIDALIAEQEKLIALLAEKRQATISHAVTRGLNPDAPMKDSGVAWLGEVPAHWEVRRLKQIVRPGVSVSYGIVQPGEPLEEGIPFVQTSNMSDASFGLHQLQRTTPEIASAYPRSQLMGGEVILGIRASIGAAYVVPVHLAGANLSRGIARIECCDDVTSKYLVYALRSSATAHYWGLSKQGSTFNEVSIETVRELALTVPPLSEQGEIADFLDAELFKLDALQTQSERGVGLLQERRSALIAAAVTGQIDVRGAVAASA